MRLLASNVLTQPNKLLASLPQAEWDALRPDLRRSRAVRGQVLLEHGQAADTAYFIEDGVVSLAACAGGGDAGRGVQVAMIGPEGVVGGVALLGRAAACVDAAVQFPGNVLSIPAATLQRRMEELPGLHRACTGYMHDLLAQLVEVAASNAQDSVVRRCARWLLMADDRVGGCDLPVTHETLALLLGVRRPGVTLAMAVLHGEGLIRTRRGSVRLLDRPGLEAFSVGRPVRATPRAPQRVDGMALTA